MTHPSRSAEQEHAFKSLYEEVYGDLVKFVQRRTDHDRAEDVVADVFLVVWRRFQDAPGGLDGARAWVFGIARNVLLNERRGELRRSALGVRLADTASLPQATAEVEAIVNRVDLRQNTVYGGGSAGEGRFVFALVDVASCTPQPMTVIFEYGIQKPSCSAVKAWAQQWQNLGSLLPVGSAAFNSALEAITVQFTEAGTNPSQLPNRSSLNQLRTNEIALASPWELREFRIAADDSDIGHLREVTVKQNPDDDLNLTPKLADYINANSASVLTDSHTVPIAFPSSASPFLGGSAPVPPSFWDGPPASLGTANLRHHFSLNTCNGCHSGETQAPFTHIHPAGGVSGFMTGIDVNDPAGEAVIRHFDDQLRRQVSMAQLLSQPCFFHVFFSPLRMVH